MIIVTGGERVNGHRWPSPSCSDECGERCAHDGRTTLTGRRACLLPVVQEVADRCDRGLEHGVAAIDRGPEQRRHGVVAAHAERARPSAPTAASAAPTAASPPGAAGTAARAGRGDRGAAPARSAAGGSSARGGEVPRADRHGRAPRRTSAGTTPAPGRARQATAPRPPGRCPSGTRCVGRPTGGHSMVAGPSSVHSSKYSIASSPSGFMPCGPPNWAPSRNVVSACDFDAPSARAAITSYSAPLPLAIAV